MCAGMFTCIYLSLPQQFLTELTGAKVSRFIGIKTIITSPFSLLSQNQMEMWTLKHERHFTCTRNAERIKGISFWERFVWPVGLVKTIYWKFHVHPRPILTFHFRENGLRSWCFEDANDGQLANKHYKRFENPSKFEEIPSENIELSAHARILFSNRTKVHYLWGARILGW